MTPRERVLAILGRAPVDRLPVDIWCVPEVECLLHEHFGTRDALQLYREMGLDKIVWFSPVYRVADVRSPTGSASADEPVRSRWGAPLRKMKAGAATYQEYAGAPLSSYPSPASLNDYPFWPDPDRFDYEGMLDTARAASRDFVVMGPWVSLFEIYCELRGLQQSLTDLARDPVYVDAVLDVIERIQTQMLRRLLDDAARYLDLVFVSDDMASQTGLLISPRMWDRFFRDRLRRWCNLIHGYGLRVFFHTDGAAEALVPRLIDVGIDVLNPIQHVCPGMDCAALQARYGDRLVFHGGVDNQHVLPFGTTEDVRAETRACMRTLGAGRRGYIVCSCHNVQAGTPLENVLAMVDTVKKEGAF
jgi:uroporphyrinogen decarboxylase